MRHGRAVDGDRWTVDAPPKVTQRIAAELLSPAKREAGRGIVPRAGLDGGTALAGKDPFASLPVLGAVRQFIDNERRRTRRMILNLVLLFAVVLMSFVAAFIYIAEIQLGRVKTDLEKGQATISAAASQIGSLKKDIAEEAQRLDRQLAEGGKQAEAALAAVKTLDAGITNAVAELQSLKSKIGSVDDLKSESITALRDLDSKWIALSDRLDELSRQNFSLQARLAEKPNSPPYAQVLSAVGGEGIMLDLAASNSESRINWRLPMP